VRFGADVQKTRTGLVGLTTWNKTSPTKAMQGLSQDDALKAKETSAFHFVRLSE
jgi:hypothetical protein